MIMFLLLLSVFFVFSEVVSNSHLFVKVYVKLDLKTLFIFVFHIPALCSSALLYESKKNMNL